MRGIDERNVSDERRRLDCIGTMQGLQHFGCVDVQSCNMVNEDQSHHEHIQGSGRQNIDGGSRARIRTRPRNRNVGEWSVSLSDRIAPSRAVATHREPFEITEFSG